MQDATNVQIGGYTVLAGGMHMDPTKLNRADVLVSLHRSAPPSWPEEKPREGFVVPDFTAPEQGAWKSWLVGTILPMLDKGTYLVVHCAAGIGRTGMFLASLVALLEPEVEDPIAAVRERYCSKAVETLAQGELVFALKGKTLPSQYRTSLWR